MFKLLAGLTTIAIYYYLPFGTDAQVQYCCSGTNSLLSAINGNQGSGTTDLGFIRTNTATTNTLLTTANSLATTANSLLGTSNINTANIAGTNILLTAGNANTAKIPDITAAVTTSNLKLTDVVTNTQELEDLVTISNTKLEAIRGSSQSAASYMGTVVTTTTNLTVTEESIRQLTILEELAVVSPYVAGTTTNAIPGAGNYGNVFTWLVSGLGIQPDYITTLKTIRQPTGNAFSITGIQQLQVGMVYNQKSVGLSFETYEFDKSTGTWQFALPAEYMGPREIAGDITSIPDMFNYAGPASPKLYNPSFAFGGIPQLDTVTPWGEQMFYLNNMAHGSDNFCRQVYTGSTLYINAGIWYAGASRGRGFHVKNHPGYIAAMAGQDCRDDDDIWMIKWSHNAGWPTTTDANKAWFCNVYMDFLLTDSANGYNYITSSRQVLGTSVGWNGYGFMPNNMSDCSTAEGNECRRYYCTPQRAHSAINLLNQVNVDVNYDFFNYLWPRYQIPTPQIRLTDTPYNSWLPQDGSSSTNRVPITICYTKVGSAWNGRALAHGWLRMATNQQAHQIAATGYDGYAVEWLDVELDMMHTNRMFARWVKEDGKLVVDTTYGSESGLYVSLGYDGPCSLSSPVNTYLPQYLLAIQMKVF